MRIEEKLLMLICGLNMLFAKSKSFCIVLLMITVCFSYFSLLCMRLILTPGYGALVTLLQKSRIVRIPIN